MRDYAGRYAACAGVRVDRRLDRLFSSLEAQFGAAIARAEDEAAADLAFSLSEDQTLRERLASGGWCVRSEAGARRISEVGADHVRVEPGSEIVPLECAVFVEGPGQPVRSEATLGEVLREQARRGAELVVRLEDQVLAGRCISCGEGHVVVSCRGRRHIVPLGLIRSLTLSLGG